MNKDLELCISHENNRKLIIFEPTTTLDDFKKMLKEQFLISFDDFELLDMRRNAQITSTKSFKEENEIAIQVKGNQSESQELQASQVHQNSNLNDRDVDFELLLEERFKEDTMLDEMNIWSNELGFKLILSEGAKQMKDGVKKTLICHVKDCTYRLYVKSDKNERFYQVYEKLSRKYTQHSMDFLLFFCHKFF